MRRAANQNIVVVEGGTQPSYNYPQSSDAYYQNIDQPQYNNPNNQNYQNPTYQNPNQNPNYQNMGNAAYEMGAVNLNNQPYFGQPV